MESTSSSPAANNVGMGSKRLSQACDSCRLRKMKCSKDYPTCLKCKEHGWKCVYSPKIIRSPLTRVYMNQIEKKAENLEKILRRILPEDIEIQELIRMVELEEKGDDKDVDGINQQFFKQIDITPKDLSKVPVTLKNINEISQSKFNQEDKKIVDSVKDEYQPEDYLINIKQSDLNCFDERDDNIKPNVYDSSIDGMAALSNDTGLTFDRNTSNGYFGINSSNGLLKFLQLKLEQNGNSIIELNLSSMDSEVDDLEYELGFNLDEQINEIWNTLNSGKMEDLLDDMQFQNLMVNAFFELYYQVYPIINKKRFFKTYEKYKTDPLFNEQRMISFMILLNTILAIGVWCKFGENSRIHNFYYQRVKYYTLQINIFEYGDTQLLDSFTLLSNYVQKTNRPNTGWSYLGLATRIATSLGLHKEVKIDDSLKHNLELFEEIEIRKRQFWGIYFFDVGTTLTFGRPLTIPPLSTIDLEPVSNIDDELFKQGFPIEKIKVTYPTIYTALIYESELTKISTRIYNYNSSVIKLKNDKSKMIGLLDMNDLLTNFIKTLPPYFNEDEGISRNAVIESGYKVIPKWWALSRLRLIARYKNLQILVFRFILWETIDVGKDATHLGLVEKCKEIVSSASVQTVFLVDSFINNNELDYLSSWYATYFLFQAILIPILKIIINQDLSQNKNIVHQTNTEVELNYIDMAKVSFTKLKKYNKLAGKFIKLIDLLLYGQKNTINTYKNDFEMFNNFDEFLENSDFKF